MGNDDFSGTEDDRINFFEEDELDADVDDLFPDYGHMPINYKKIITAYFEEKKPLEQIIHSMETRLNAQNYSDSYYYDSWFTIEAIMERLIDGQKPENFRKKFYKTLKKLEDQVYDGDVFIPLFVDPAPVRTGWPSYPHIIRHDYPNQELRAEMESLMNDKEATKDLETFSKSLYEIFGPTKKGILGYFVSEKDRSEFAHCIRIVNQIDKVFPDEKIQKAVSAYLLEHSLSDYHLDESEDEGAARGYDRVMKMLKKEKKKLSPLLKEMYIDIEGGDSTEFSDIIKP